MKSLPKIFLAASAALLLLSFTPFGNEVYYGILKPLSAIFFIVFFILQMTQKEVELFEAEQHQPSQAKPAPSAKKAATSRAIKGQPAVGTR